MKRLHYSSYYDRVLGGWLGKCIGGSLGAPTEGIKSSNNVEFYENTDKAQIANDDLDIQLVWIHALKERGLNLTSCDLMEEWVAHVSFPWSEYGYALRNFKTGILPPQSGKFNNSFYGESMGCPIRSEIWGMICPGCPELAADYAGMDAGLDHFGNSVYAERFLSAMEAAAFVENDIRRLIEIGLSVIPSQSRLAQCVNGVITCFDNAKSVDEARRHVINRFGSPDFTSSVQNMGFIVTGLLYGLGDFERSVLLAVNCGYDSDCTGATVGAIMGIVIGAEDLPRKWVDPIGEEIVSLLKIEELLDNPSIYALSSDTCSIGLALSQSGKTGVTILGSPAEIEEAAWGYIHNKKHGIKVDVEYLGSPSISFDDPGKAVLKIRNLEHRDISGTIDIFASEHLITSFTRLDFHVAAEDTFEIEVSISVQTGVNRLPLINQVEYVCRYEDKTTNGSFGFHGAAQWLIVGPFWEAFPVSAIPPGRFHAHTLLTLPPYESMVLNATYLDKEYIHEPKPGWTRIELNDSGKNIERVLINSPEDKVDLDAVFPLKGPQTVYLYREIWCDTPRKAWVVMGANDGIKLWVNGDLCLMSNRRMFTFPGHHSTEINLRRGVNTVLVKAIRSGNCYDFSFAIKEHNDRHWHQEQHMVDYSTINLSDMVQEQLGSVAGLIGETIGLDK